MSEVTTLLALVMAFSMITWWKWIRGRGDLFGFESSFGMIGFAIGSYVSYKTFGLVSDLPDLLYFVAIPVCCYISVETIIGILTFRRSTINTLSLTNIEERTKKMQELGVEKMLKKLKAQPLNVSLRGNSLYVIDSLIPNYELKYLVYQDPSTPKKIYGCFVPSHFNTADEAMAWKFYITEEEYKEDLKFEA